MLIKIDRSSIRKNKDAGSTLTYVPTRWSSSFDYKGKIKPIVDGQEEWFAIESNLLRHGVDYVLTDIHNVDQNLLGEVSGQFIKPFDFNVIKKIGGFSNILETRELAKIQHRPIQQYSFRYEDVELTCLSCKKPTLKSQIENYIDEESGDSYDLCPNCLSLDSFEPVEFEEIDTVINSQQ